MSKKLNRLSAGAVFNACMVGNTIDGNAISGQIKWIGQTGPKLDATIHGVAVACIGMSLPHADGGHNCAIRAVQLVNTLADLNKSARTKTLIAWFTAMSNIRIRKGDDGRYVGAVLKPSAKGYNPDVTTGAAMAKPFWSVEEKAPDAKAFLFGDAVAALIKRAKDNLDTMSDADKAALAALEAAAPKLTAKPKANA